MSVLVWITTVVPQHPAHQLIIRKARALFAAGAMILIAKGDPLAIVAEQLAVLEGAAFDIAGQVGQHPLAMTVGFTKIGAHPREMAHPFL